MFFTKFKRIFVIVFNLMMNNYNNIILVKLISNKFKSLSISYLPNYFDKY